jgi:hypothetical protein
MALHVLQKNQYAVVVVLSNFMGGCLSMIEDGTNNPTAVDRRSWQHFVLTFSITINSNNGCEGVGVDEDDNCHEAASSGNCSNNGTGTPLMGGGTRLGSFVARWWLE